MNKERGLKLKLDAKIMALVDVTKEDFADFLKAELENMGFVEVNLKLEEDEY